MRILKIFVLVFAGMSGFPISVVRADEVGDATINESVSVYIDDEGTSKLLVKGMRAQVLAIDGDYALINLTLQNGNAVQTQIPTKYLTVSLLKHEPVIAGSLLGPNPTTATPIVAPVLPQDNAPTATAMDDFFTIGQVTYCGHAGMGPFLHKDVDVTDKDNKTTTTQVYTPYLAAQIRVQARVKADDLTVRAYFYDSDKKLVGTVDTPAIGDEEVFLNPDSKQTVYFVLPDNVLKVADWSAIVVFGDSKSVAVQSFPRLGEESEYAYQESKLFNHDSLPSVRSTAMDPLTEYTVNKDNVGGPQITLFLRPPTGMTDASKAKGVMALSLLSEDLWNIRHNLQSADAGKDVTGMLQYADEHKLIVICWGSRGLWNPTKNWDDESPDELRQYKTIFDDEANAWEKGVQHFIKEYGIPKNNYLLWGESGSAQFDCRLALRKPDYFLAVRLHIESSYDKPTLGANRILWCLTTGELEAGYQRSLRFYAQCRKLGYPMIYKAIPGIGHEGNDAAHDLGEAFFDYALTLADQRTAYDQANALVHGDDPIDANPETDVQPWPEAFRKPVFIGDIVNQEMVPSDQIDMVPLGFRTPIPTKQLAEIWNLQ
jgi:hypothetical protein